MSHRLETVFIVLSPVPGSLSPREIKAGKRSGSNERQNSTASVPRLLVTRAVAVRVRDEFLHERVPVVYLAYSRT